MISHHVYYQLVILVLIWLCVMLPHLWPSLPHERPKRLVAPIKPKRKRSAEPKAFAGLTQKPPCPLCEQATADMAPVLPQRPYFYDHYDNLVRLLKAQTAEVNDLRANQTLSRADLLARKKAPHNDNGRYTRDGGAKVTTPRADRAR